MKLSKALPVILALLMAGSALAALMPEHQAFGTGPARYLMTKDELKQWKSMSSDTDAQAFIDLFWARRDPTPATPQNEFRADYDALVTLADKQFTVGQVPGSMNDRGKYLILLGTPTKIVRSRAISSAEDEEGSSSMQESWLYSGENVPKFSKASEFTIIFKDEGGRGDYRLAQFGQKVNVNDLAQKAVEASIASPNMKEVPKYVQAQPVPKPAPAPAAAAGLKSDALKAAVEEVKTGKATYPKAAISYDEFVTPNGTHYVPIQFYLPKSLGLTADSVATFFGVVTDASGAVVTSYEESAKLLPTRNDFFFDKSLTLSPGKYTAILGIAAADGKPVVASSIAMDLAGREKDTVGISKMILSNNIYPLTAAQAPTDPYSFGGIKVIPKSDYAFTKADDLWYFIELQNPGLDPTTNAPKIQVKLDLEGITGKDKVKDKVKMGAPLAEAAAEALKGVPGHYGIGSSIPLASFKPGDYTLKIKVIDTVSKQNYNMEQSFKVVGEK